MDIFDLYASDKPATTMRPAATPTSSKPKVAGMPPRPGLRPAPAPATTSKPAAAPVPAVGKPESVNKRRQELDNAFQFALDVLKESEVDSAIRALIDHVVESAKKQIAQFGADAVPTKTEAPDWYMVIEQYESLLKPAEPEVQAKPEPKTEPGKVPGRVYPSWYPRLLRYIQRRPVIALVGPAGNGKTTAAQFAGEELGFNVYEHDCTEYDTVYSLIGAMSMAGSNGEFGEKWVDGKITRWLRDPKAVIILNEFDSLNPKVAMLFQSLFQRPNADGTGRYLMVGDPNVPNGRLVPAGPCPIVLTMNTYGTGANRQYVGRNRLDAATLDRISLIETGYENEVEIIQYHGFSREIGVELSTWAASIRAKINRAGGMGIPVILSNRTLLNIAEAIELDGLSWGQAIEEEFYSQIDPTYRNDLR